MRHDYGHANAAERDRIDLLEGRVESGVASTEELLELALLNLEPAHEVEVAARLLRSLVSSNERNHLALFWLAYCCVYELLSPQALREAVAICNRILDSDAARELKAGALLLKATALRDLGDEAFPIAELLQSIALAPDWFSNRQLLAQILMERGDLHGAAEQLRAALAIEPGKPQGRTLPEALFEELVTVRVSSGVRDRIAEQLQKIDLSSTPG